MAQSNLPCTTDLSFIDPLGDIPFGTLMKHICPETCGNCQGTTTYYYLLLPTVTYYYLLLLLYPERCVDDPTKEVWNFNALNTKCSQLLSKMHCMVPIAYVTGEATDTRRVSELCPKSCAACKGTCCTTQPSFYNFSPVSQSRNQTRMNFQVKAGYPGQYVFMFHAALQIRLALRLTVL